jgi:hypothetical protein
VQFQNAPARLFKDLPSLYLQTEQKTCPVDGQRLYVQKTCERTIMAIGIGPFIARFAVFYCKSHSHLGVWRPKELDELAPDNSNVAYSVIVEIGRLRFMENRQVIEIQSLLFEQHSIWLSTSEIELLIDKFVFYLAVVHQQSHKLINEQIKAQGGYILHLDSTCEGDSPKMASSFDSVSGFVLYSAKLRSENTDEIVPFLEKIKHYFGVPLAVVSDMSKSIEAAVKEVFGSIGHYVCHYHFLSAVGKSLFESEHNDLRQSLSKIGISGALKKLRRKMNNGFATFTLENIEHYLAQPEQLGKTREATEILAYYLILWTLDHSADGNGYGFPFDQRYLYFYQRLEAAQTLIRSVASYYPAKTNNDAIIWKLYHLIDQVVSDASLKQTVAAYKAKLAVFSDLRRALGIAPEPANNGLTQMSTISSTRELSTIRTAVNHFMKKLKQKIAETTDPKLRSSFKNVKERVEKYWEKLFADPLVVRVNGQEKCLFVQRTNNIMEKHFRQLNYGYRRIHGNHSVRRNLENIPEQLPLVENLKNPNYVQLVFQDTSKIARRFSKVDVKIIRKMAAENHSKKQVLCSRKIKNIIRKADFKDQLITAFKNVAA